MPSLSVPNTLRLYEVQLQLSRTDRESLKLGTRKKAAFLSKGQRPMIGGVSEVAGLVTCSWVSLTGHGL